MLPAEAPGWILQVAAGLLTDMCRALPNLARAAAAAAVVAAAAAAAAATTD
jgi:hypothetical protein